MKTQYVLNWKKADFEAGIGLPSAKFTGVNAGLAFFLGLVFTGIFYGVLYPLRQLYPGQDFLAMFFHGGEANRSSIPYYTVFLTMWCLAFLFIKWRKLRGQRKALQVHLMPDVYDFVLSPDTSAEVLHHLEKIVYHPEGFLVLARVQKALANLKNLGRVADVSSVLNDLATADEKYIDSTYMLPKGLIWAIPVTGFIGTVLGLSGAVGGFGRVVTEGAADFEKLTKALGGVTGGLSVAFETTLIALVAALVVQLLMTLLARKESQFLDDCSGYCYDNVVTRLRLVDIREELDNGNA